MKGVFALLFAVLAFAAAHHHAGHGDYKIKTKEDLLKYRELCTQKLNIGNDLIEKYKKWEYPDDNETHCYIKCFFENLGLFDESKGFDVENIHHQLLGENGEPDHNDDLHKKIENCAERKPEYTDNCLFAYRGAMCFIKENLRLVKSSVNAD